MSTSFLRSAALAYLPLTWGFLWLLDAFAPVDLWAPAVWLTDMLVLLLKLLLVFHVLSFPLRLILVCWYFLHGFLLFSVLSFSCYDLVHDVFLCWSQMSRYICSSTIRLMRCCSPDFSRARFVLLGASFLYWCTAYWYPTKTSLLEFAGTSVPWLIADMIILHSPVETYIFSFSFLQLLFGLLPCVSTIMLPASLFSSAALVMMTHT
jgi:hypothetical protein